MSAFAHSYVGHKSFSEDVRGFDKGTVQIISCAPRQSYDSIRSKSLCTKNLAYLMEEDAELLNKGLEEKSYDVCMFFPPSTQVALISVTIPMEVLDMAQKLMIGHVKVLLGTSDVIYSIFFITF